MISCPLCLTEVGAESSVELLSCRCGRLYCWLHPGRVSWIFWYGYRKFLECRDNILTLGHMGPPTPAIHEDERALTVASAVEMAKIDAVLES